MQKIMNWEKHLTVGVIIGFIGQMFWTPLFWLFLAGIIAFEIYQAFTVSMERAKVMGRGIAEELFFYMQDKWIDSIADIIFGLLGYIIAIFLHAVFKGTVL